MKYLLDDNGYVDSVYFGCNTGSCVEYTGAVPTGYSTIEEWAMTANVKAYKIEGGNLVLDSARLAELNAEALVESEKNRYVTAEELYNVLNISREVTNQEFSAEAKGNNLLKLTGAGNYSIPRFSIKKCAVWGDLTGKWSDYASQTWETIGRGINPVTKVEIVTCNKNLLPSKLATSTNKGITYSRGADGTISLSGTSTEAVEIDLCGSSTSTEMLFMLKTGISYVLSGMSTADIKLYSYDGTDRTQVYANGNGVITVTANTIITQATVPIANGETVSLTLSPQIEVGTTATEFVVNERYYKQIDVEMDNGDTLYFYDGKITLNGVLIKYDNGIRTPNADTWFMCSCNAWIDVVYCLPSVIETVKTMNIEADRINLNGYVSNENNSFAIDEDGNMSCKSAAAERLIINNGPLAITENGVTTWEYLRTFQRSNYSSADATAILNLVTSGTTPTQAQIERYDINGDGKIKTGDSVVCQNLVNGTYGSWVKSGQKIVIDLVNRKPFTVYQVIQGENGYSAETVTFETSS